jgi:primosomal protein N'
VLITARCQDAALAEGALLDLHGRLKRILPESVSMGEPVASPLAKAQDHFRFQLMLRSASVRSLCARLREAMRDWKPGKNVGIGVDVDSYQLG